MALHRKSFPPNSQSPILVSDQKKGGLDIGHPHNPPLPSSGEPIKGPIRGTQTSPWIKERKNNIWICISISFNCNIDTLVA